jgi:hypothetical protein
LESCWVLRFGGWYFESGRGGPPDTVDEGCHVGCCWLSLSIAGQDPGVEVSWVRTRWSAETEEDHARPCAARCCAAGVEEGDRGREDVSM